MNEKMAQLKASVDKVIVTFPDGYRELFEGFFESVVTLYRSMDGWSVDRAIEAQGVVVAQENEEKKRKGVLGLFGK